MILRRWLDDSARRRAARQAAALRAWLEATRAVEQACLQPLGTPDLVPDAAVLLLPVDRQLPRLRLHAAALHGALRRHDRALAERFGQATNLTFRLRNLTAVFLLRAQDARRAAAPRPGAASPQARSERARDQARAAAHELQVLLRGLEGEGRLLLRIWDELAGGRGPGREPV
jgi:hypothetical protein